MIKDYGPMHGEWGFWIKRIKEKNEISIIRTRAVMIKRYLIFPLTNATLNKVMTPESKYLYLLELKTSLT
jgi:hypothetical protein